MKPKAKVFRLLLAAVAVVLVGGGLYSWSRSHPDRQPSTLEASGTVEATDALIGFEIPGTVDSVTVHEGDTVEVESEIARLRTDELQARRAQAEARIAAARARLRELEAGTRRQEIAQAEAETAAARDTLEETRREAERTRRLYEGGAVGLEADDRARTAVQVASSRLRQAEERLGLLREGPRSEQIDAQRALLGEARAALEAIDVRLAKSVLAAPFAGRVTVRHKEPGEIVSPGTPVVTLQNPDDRWVRIYVPENRLGAVRLGESAVILSDTFPEKRYEGRVFFISDQAEFTPKNVQTQEERVRLVYAVKVRVTGDPGFELKPGMPVDVEIPLAGTAPGRGPETAGEGPSR